MNHVLSKNDPASGENGKIAFSNGMVIHVMDPDGINTTFLANGTNPDWSPDGSKIVFDYDLGFSYFLDLSVGATVVIPKNITLSIGSMTLNGYSRFYQNRFTRSCADKCVITERYQEVSVCCSMDSLNITMKKKEQNKGVKNSVDFC